MASLKSDSGIGIAYQIPRNTLALLMVAQAVVILPYLLQLSVWIILVAAFCGLWRTRVYQGRWDYPNRWVKAGLVIAAVTGVFMSGTGAFSLEAAASLLLVAFSLKLIEMKSRSDAYLVIFLSYFVIATAFLFDQTLLIALYELAAMVVVTAALVGLNQLHVRVRPLVTLRVAGTLVLQALPLTVVLFMLFPRIAPLWTVPLPSAGTTGISDSVTPGDFASLTQSDELAFRVVFEERIPLPRDLYWRGLVYSHLDGATWRADRVRRAGVAAVEPGYGSVYEYEVLLEPTMRDWLYAMDNAYAVDTGVSKMADFRLQAADPVMSVFRYRVRSYPEQAMDTELSPLLRLRETRLSDRGNDRSRAFAHQLFDQQPDTEGFVRAVLSHIRNAPYRYTLKPPLYPRRDSIDEFWFDGRAGFCSHYAGAFVFLMRAVGIPARMVGGYQGGEINPITGHLMIRQYDAHAWAEVWIEDEGWRRVDPTAAVAPERIEQGLRAALSESDRATLSVLTNARMGEWGLLGGFLNWTDSVEHRWNLWVVGYDTHFQARFLQQLLGELTPLRLGLALLTGGAISLGVVALALFWRRREVNRHPVEKLFRAFSDKLGRYGYQRLPEESPSAFVRRLAAEVGLKEAQVGSLIAELDTLLYNPGVAWGNAELKTLRGQLRRLQFRLAFGARR